MAQYRNDLPQLSGDLFLTDGGLETTLIFHEGLELPHFAAFDLMRSDEGLAALSKYYRIYASLAEKYEVGFILESATWRASPDWGKKLGYSSQELTDINRQSIQFLEEIRNQERSEKTRMVICGCLGPRGDGYNPAFLMSEEQAEAYHATQVETFSETEADMLSAMTMTHVEEAIGIVRAAGSAGMTIAISFTVETDGRLPTGQSLKAAIEKLDEVTDSAPAYYMINCAHPLHFQNVLAAGEPWVERIRGLRANASARSHAELDEAEELDDGNPVELGSQYRELRSKLSKLNVLGGCCGTDHRHVEEMCKAFLP